MATVKFISEKNCRLFVDMDFVGDILMNTVLKITLDTGSYLVEAKDSNGRTIKKYVLNINSEDTQVLQNITLHTNNIEDSISILKENSSLRFYNQRALLKHDDKYGYVNSQYKLVIAPIYSYAEDFFCCKTLVRRKFPDREMATIIDTNGNICYERWFDYIGSSNDTILLKDKDKYIVFLRKDFSILSEYFDAGYNGTDDLIPVYKKEGVDNNYGFIDKSGYEIVPFIYDFVCNFEESGYAIVKSYGHFYAVDRFGNSYHVEEFDNCVGRIPSNEEEKKEHLRYSKKESIEKHTATEEEYYHTFKSDKFLFEADINYPLCKYIACRVGKSCILIYEEFDGADKYGREVYKEEERYEFKADSIEPITEFRIGCGIDEFAVRFVIIKRNRKYGIAKTSGEMLLPVEYDYIIPIIYCDDGYNAFPCRDWLEKRIDGFICKKEDEYIYINGKGKYMYSVEYSMAYNFLKNDGDGCPFLLSQISTINCIKNNNENIKQEKGLQV